MLIIDHTLFSLIVWFYRRKKESMGEELRVEGEMVIKSPAHKFFKRLSEELHHLPDATPDRVHGVQVHEGDFKTHGSIKSWTYTLDGKQEIFKEKFEIDEESMSVRMVALGGDILERLKSCKLIYKVISKGDGASARFIVTILYEKLDNKDETDWEPIKELDFLIGMLKDVDKHLIQQQP